MRHPNTLVDYFLSVRAQIELLQGPDRAAYAALYGQTPTEAEIDERIQGFQTQCDEMIALNNPTLIEFLATEVREIPVTEEAVQAKTMTLNKISVRLYFNEANICLGGLALEIYSKNFSFTGDYYYSKNVQIYPSQDVQGKTWPIINKERVKIWYEALKAKNA